ncbi:helix-turn-helix domain-containing protein [Streptomyces sp. NPDC050738]|uniref:helix-turn-helix domain-containing protein n=1 Tax=Streptomyces sp. NPDC050738 TaxID=3154744 RepID=UPI0034253584
MADPQSSVGTSAHPGVPIPADAPRSGVLHVRHRHTDRFTVVGNHLAQHPSLSATAIGFAVHIQSLPDGASVTVKTLTLRFPEGETTVRRALNELEEAGYLERSRVPLGGGRFATRAFFYDRPGAAQAVTPPTAPTPPIPLETTAVIDPADVRPKPQPAPTTGPAPDLLARLRLADSRLLLSANDVYTLTPAVETWLNRGATPAQITRTLTANLPPEPASIHHPARFLEHRLTTLLPPPLPAGPAPTAQPPLQSCEGCERAIRSHDSAVRCRDCRPAVPA